MDFDAEADANGYYNEEQDQEMNESYVSESM